MTILQRFINAFKADLLLLLSIKLWKLLLIATSCLACVVLGFIYPQYAKHFHLCCATIMMMAFWYFFYKLKKQKFFTHLILNRGFFSVSLEIFLFLFPYLLIGLAFDLPYLIKFGKNATGTLNFIMICEALCLVLAWFWRYMVARIVISVFETIIHFNPEMIASKQSGLDMMLNQQHSVLCCIVCVAIQILAMGLGAKANIRKTLSI